MKLRQLVILLTLLAAFGLRADRLSSQSLRGDEAASVLYSALPLSSLWELSRVTDPHPPLYYALLHPWQAALGESAFVMRFFGVLAGVLAVAALYRLARETLRRNSVALLAAGVLAINPLQIWLAQDVRSYPLFTLLGLLSSWALWRAVRFQRAKYRVQNPEHRPPFAIRHSQFAIRNSPLARWGVYVALTVASLYTHYYTVFLIAFQGLFFLLNFKTFRADWRRWLAAQFVIGLLILPGLMLAARFAGGEAGGGVAVVGLPEILRRTAAGLLTGFTLDASWGLALSLILLPVWLAGAITLVRRDFTSGSFWLLFFAVPVLGVVALSIGKPLFKERFLVQAQPAFHVLLAAGLVWIYNLGFTIGKRPLIRFAARTAAIGLLILLLLANLRAISNYHTQPAYAKAPPWQLYHDFVAGKSAPGDVMLTNFPEASVSYYSPDNLPFYVIPTERGHDRHSLEAQTEQVARAYRRIWFLPLLREGFDPDGDVLNWLDRHADRVDQIFFPMYNLNLYLGPSAIEELMIPQPAGFAHGIHLRGFQVLDKRGQSRFEQTDPATGLPVLSLQPEDKVTLSLYWQADGPTPEPATVFVHLLAADGFNRTGQDNPPVWGSYPTTEWLPGERITDKFTLTLPPGTPPGDHRLQVGWYNSNTQARIPRLNPAADHILLDAIIRVEP